jgi:hypothetical protein
MIVQDTLSAATSGPACGYPDYILWPGMLYAIGLLAVMACVIVIIGD